MLSAWPWMRPTQLLLTELMQQRDEGKELGDTEALCKKLAAHSGELEAEQLAQALLTFWNSLPVKEGYPYQEPSTLLEIQALRPKDRSQDRPSLSSEKQLRDRLTGAFSGRIAGCLLGKPVEGWMRKDLLDLEKRSGNYPLSHYFRASDFPSDLLKKYQNRCWADRLDGAAPSDDDTNYTLLGLLLMEQKGWNFTSEDVLECWLSHLPLAAVCTAERVAYRNGANGLLPPETATTCNPYREWIGAQIRADFFGYACPGQPEKAAALAFRDAAISHVKNGIYGEMWIAAMLAEAAITDDLFQVLKAGLGQIPSSCRLQEDIQRVICWKQEGISLEEATLRIHQQWKETNGHHWCHTNSNAMIVVMALLWGDMEFGKTVCAAVQAGFDTDCNGATAGSVLGMMLGKNGIPTQWTEPFSRGLSSDITGCSLTPIETLVERTLAVIQAGKGS